MSIESDPTLELVPPFGALRTELPSIPYIEAKHYNRAVTRERVKWVVLHCTDTPEGPNRAERMARYFADLIPDDRKASAHFGVDENSIVQCVPERRIAYGAKGANQWGLHIEHGGLGKQTRAEWLDAGSLPMLDLSAMLVGVRLAPRWSIPLDYVNAAGLIAGQNGITTHYECVKAFGGTHRDPGPQFPIELYIARCRQYRAAREPLRV